MSTKAFYSRGEIGPGKVGFAKTRSIIEAAFYGNNVIKVESVAEAYELAKNSPGTIVTDLHVYEPEKQGLPKNAKVLLFNDGSITGRYKAARRIAGEPGVDTDKLDKILMDAVYDTRYTTMYHAETVIGLAPDFMVKAHLLIPEGEENLLYNWMLNFQTFQTRNLEYMYMYGRESKFYENEPDIYIFSDPQWKGLEQSDICDKNCLAYFTPESNCAAILGMRYFGEHKKGTLTLAWGIANRNGYASCHGGQKRYKLKDGTTYVASVFGLSGSGKSTLTHAKHDGKYDVTVLHDDAFIINTVTGSSIALEPTYFDKTADYPCDSPDNKYLLTVQNCSATLDEDGRIVPVTEDIRNGNGRAIKSKLWSPNRVDEIKEPVNGIFWIMKDPTLPPVLKVNGAELASAMGATLATKRSSAERLAEGVDPNALVYEPYANPFRTYPLVDDYEKFRDLVKNNNVDCYIINTGDFMGKKVTKEVTLGILEAIVEGTAEFTNFGPFSELQVMNIPGFEADLTHNDDYSEAFFKAMEDRIDYLKSNKEGINAVPDEAIKAIEDLIFY
ncbi:MAG: phosphoenolpyruvate carboxykinase (ATP) [Clostridia bacterium]|nr:phosphoenolpyruvate carboxykinase (ATP) [Clostridia bacterium]